MTSNAIEAVQPSKRFVIPAERRTSFKERLVRGRLPSHREFWALRDASFAVPKGSSLGLIGPNGSGKSTALKVLTGIYRPTSGHVSVNGAVSALLEVGAGFHPELTGRANIRLNATILGFTNREIDRLMDQIIEFADIGEHIDAPIKHYSSGMYVRLGFAVAVMVRPEILLVDEVIAVGDEEFQRKCFEHLYWLRRQGTTMIIVSHGMAQITDLCDQALWVDHGVVKEHGPVRPVVRAYIETVNAAEARRSEVGNADRDPGPARLADRPGSGELRVVDVEFLDDGGLPTAVLTTGRQATVRLSYEAQTDLAGVILWLGFEDEEARVVCGMNNSDNRFTHVRAGRGHLQFQADPLLLAEGPYRVRYSVYQPGHVLDAGSDGNFVTVRGPAVDMDGSYLQLGSWSMHSA